MCTQTPKKLIWIYCVEQPELFKTIKEMSRLEKSKDRGSLCIFDDIMNEVSYNATISKLFTRGRSHLGCSLALMLQNIFPTGSQSRTININAQYQVLFRNPRDSLQISILASQLCPLNSKCFLLMDIYFVVLHSLVQMKSVIAQMFYRMNNLLFCINFDFIQFCI